MPATHRKLGYDIPLKQHFYRYELPRELETVEADIKTLEREIASMFTEVMA